MPPIWGQLVIGPPGSGKTTYCQNMGQFLKSLGRKVAIVNIGTFFYNSFCYCKTPICIYYNFKNFGPIILNFRNIFGEFSYLYFNVYELINSKQLSDKNLFFFLFYTPNRPG